MVTLKKTISLGAKNVGASYMLMLTRDENQRDENSWQ